MAPAERHSPSAAAATPRANGRPGSAARGPPGSDASSQPKAAGPAPSEREEKACSSA